jgi:hypothetical protein
MATDDDGEMRTVTVDGKPAVVGPGVVTGADVLRAAGVEPDGAQVLVRTDGGSARVVAADAPIEVPGGSTPSFRSFRADAVRHLRVAGAVWAWGAPAIMEAEIREIADLDDDYEVVVDGEGIRPGGLVDLTGEFPPLVGLRPRRDQRAMVPIVVNGRERTVEERELTFERLVELAFPQLPVEAGRSFTVTYRRGPADRPEGSLVSHQATRLEPGTRFNVTSTTKS